MWLMQEPMVEMARVEPVSTKFEVADTINNNPFRLFISGDTDWLIGRYHSISLRLVRSCSRTLQKLGFDKPS